MKDQLNKFLKFEKGFFIEGLVATIVGAIVVIIGKVFYMDTLIQLVQAHKGSEFVPNKQETTQIIISLVPTIIGSFL